MKLVNLILNKFKMRLSSAGKPTRINLILLLIGDL